MSQEAVTIPRDSLLSLQKLINDNVYYTDGIGLLILVKWETLTFSFLLWRLIKLLEQIMGEKENKTLIFAETKRRTDELTRKMRKDG